MPNPTQFYQAEQACRKSPIVGGSIEIKLGGDKLLNEGVENLKNMYNKIDIKKMNKPSFLMVLTATGSYAYRREDGVYIVPIGCLKN